MTLDYRRVALDLLQEQEDASTIGEYRDTVTAEDGKTFEVSFDCLKAGYSGWVWTVTFSQPEKRKTALVSEVNLLAGPDALLAPSWVPWAERLAEFRKQLKLEGKAETDDEADALIAGMAGADVGELAPSDHQVTDGSKNDTQDGGGNPPPKVRVRQRRVKNNQQEQGDSPDSNTDQDDAVGSDI